MPDMVSLLGPLLEAMDLELVDVIINRQRYGVEVKLILYKEEGTSLETLTQVQKIVRPRLELEFGREQLTLEVSSPGLNRTIKNNREYKIFNGRDVKLLIENDWIEGSIVRADASAVELLREGENQRIPFDTIRRAKLA